MSRSSLAIAIALACTPACGDNHNTASAVSPDAARSSPDASQSSVTPDAAPADPSLVLRYDFEDSATGTTVADTSGQAKNATLSDITAWTTSGRNGKAIALSPVVTGGVATPQFVTLPNGVFTGVSDFTISVWVNYKTIADWMRIYDIGNGEISPPAGVPVADHWMFLTQVGAQGFHASSFGASPSNENILTSGGVGASETLPTGVWHHVALTGSGGDRQLYIDGFPTASVTNGPVVPPSSMEPIGTYAWLGKSRFGDPGLDATLDEFRVYNRVLGSAEIADLAWPQHDYSYWRFDETSGLTAKDSSDNAIPAALANAPTWTTGRVGGAIDFAGGAAGPTGADGPHVELGSSPLASCTNQMTIAAWVKLRELTVFARLVDFGTGTAAGDRFMYLVPTDNGSAGDVHFAMVGPAGAFDMTAPMPALGDGNWHHLAVTFDATGLVTLYADGASIGTQAMPTANGQPIMLPSDFAATTNNWIGRSEFAADHYLNGSVDDLRIACRAYTANEIHALGQPAAP